jgi:hypothetical protein
MSKGRERSGVASATPILALMVNDEQVTIDQRTLTMKERQVMKAALAKLDYEPDDMDALTATIWVVMRRTDPALTFDEVCEAITLESLADATEVDETAPEG